MNHRKLSIRPTVTAFGTLVLATLAVSGCRHDLTICRSEDDGPACRDSAATDVATSLPDSDKVAPVDSGDQPLDTLTDDSTTTPTDAISDGIGEDAPPIEDGAVVDSAADGGDTGGVVCAPSTRECLSSTIARTCNVGGTAWTTETCAIGCSSGKCLRATDLVAGPNRACALIDDGSIRCWGSNADGMGGGSALTAKAIPLGFSATEVAVSGDYTLGTAVTAARATDGTVRWWGDIYGGYTATPQIVSVGQKGLAVGNASICSIGSSGTVYCLGKGPLGNGTTADSAAAQPTSVSALEIAMGAGIAPGIGAVSSVFARTSAMATAWGANQFGKLATGSTTTIVTPTNSYSGAVSIAIGYEHSCAALSSGAVKCSGWNNEGQLGNSSTTNSPVPVDVVDLTGIKVTHVCAGGNHSCGVVADGTVRCWGRNSDGQLGDGAIRRTTPVAVTSLTGAVKVACGLTFSCALLSSGTVKCWGSGALGDGTTAARSNAADVKW